MKRILLAVLMAIATLVVVPAAGAVQINVNTTTDSYGGSPTDCSLREAITAAQTDSAFDGCPSGSGADSISLPGGEYKITRAGDDENSNVTGDFDITGTDTLSISPSDNEAKVVVNGNGLDRVYDQQGNNSFQVLRQAITGGFLKVVGDDGAGIRNTVGSLSVDGSTFFNNNTDYQGGAIAVYSDLNAVNSTFSGNRADGNGGALWIPGGATATVENSTITQNTADANNDMNGNGGGFADGGATSISINNSINAGNFAPAANGPDCDSGPFYFPRYTMQVQPFAAGVCLVGFSESVKVVDDPMLGPLQDNGGQTPTHALLEGSPAIGAGGSGPDSCTATDQTGRQRPTGAGQCDIGAVQYITPAPPLVVQVKISKVKPKVLKLKRGKKAKAASVVISTVGAPAAVNTKLCLKPSKATKKSLKFKGKLCRKVGTLVGAKTVKFKIAAKKKAKKKTFKVKAVLSATDATSKTKPIKVKVK